MSFNILVFCLLVDFIISFCSFEMFESVFLFKCQVNYIWKTLARPLDKHLSAGVKTDL